MNAADLPADWLVDDFKTCLGWAWEACDQPSVLVMTEYFADGYWRRQGICRKHGRDAVQGIGDEIDAPYARVWEAI